MRAKHNSKQSESNRELGEAMEKRVVVRRDKEQWSWESQIARTSSEVNLLPALALISLCNFPTSLDYIQALLLAFTMSTSRFEPSSIKNKVKREEVARKQKKQKRQDKLQRRLAQAKVEADDPVAKKVPQRQNARCSA